jgi:hypothetical protein
MKNDFWVLSDQVVKNYGLVRVKNWVKPFFFKFLAPSL